MKRIICVILCIIMLLSASVYAVADDTGNAAQIESTPILQSSYNQSFSDSGSMAYVKNSENAYSGSYCLAFGFEEPQTDQSGTVLPINTAVDFRLAEVGNSGGTYTIKFAARRVGYIRKSRVSVTEHGNTAIELMGLENIPEDKWTEFTFKYTDSTTYSTSNAHSFLKFTYYNPSPDAWSGLLIDSVSITQEELGEEAPNIFPYGDFEIVDEFLPEIDWTADSTFWGEDALDLSFMSSLPKSVAAYGVSPIKGAERFNTVITDSSFSYFTDYFISEENLELCKYLARKFTHKNKKIWITVEDIICNSDKSIKENWKALLMQYATHMQLIAGNKFQGFYFDEPSMDFTASDFLTVTEYCRTTFRKRILAIHKSIAVNPPSDYETDMAILNPDTHKYVTDIGYWKYDTWSGAGEATLNKFKKTMTSGEFDANIRKWTVPIIGRYDPCQTEADICELMENMVYGAMEIQNFGGVGFYTMAYRIVDIEQSKADETLIANSAQLLADGIIREYKNASGTAYWKYLEGNGAELLKKDPETGLAPWNNCLLLVEGIAADLYGESLRNYDIINGVAIVDTEKTTVNNFGIKAELPRNYFNFYRNNTRISGAAPLSTGDELRFSSPNNGDFKYSVAVKNDTNCDGVFNILDVVRTKKASAGKADFSAAQYAAIGISNTASPVSALAVAGLRNEILNSPYL